VFAPLWSRPGSTRVWSASEARLGGLVLAWLCFRLCWLSLPGPAWPGLVGLARPFRRTGAGQVCLPVVSAVTSVTAAAVGCCCVLPAVVSAGRCWLSWPPSIDGWQFLPVSAVHVGNSSSSGLLAAASCCVSAAAAAVVASSTTLAVSPVSPVTSVTASSSGCCCCFRCGFCCRCCCRGRPQRRWQLFSRFAGHLGRQKQQ